MRARALLLVSACSLLAFWAAAAPAPFPRQQEAVALLDMRDGGRARKILSRLEAFRSGEASPGCRLTFGEVDGGRALRLCLRTDGTADAEERLSALVERCLRDVFPDREHAAEVYQTLTEAGPMPGRTRARLTEAMRQEYAADLRQQEAEVVIQPPHKVRR